MDMLVRERSERDNCIGSNAFDGDKECFFQPFYSTEKQCIWGAEALFRLKDEYGRYYNMDDLVARAEAEGWVSKIDCWVFRETCKKIPKLREYGLKRVNINLSPAACQNPDIVENMQKVMDQYGISRSEICMEITEMCKVKDGDHFGAMVDSLVHQGIRLALDDFGKGESNLIRLLQIPFSTLKIDKEMVWAMEDNPLAGQLIEDMIAFAHRNGIQVTAEGVETRDQARELASYGCDYLQGYYISPPVDYQHLIQFFKTQGHRDFLRK